MGFVLARRGDDGRYSVAGCGSVVRADLRSATQRRSARFHHMIAPVTNIAAGIAPLLGTLAIGLPIYAISARIKAWQALLAGFLIFGASVSAASMEIP